MDERDEVQSNQSNAYRSLTLQHFGRNPAFSARYARTSRKARFAEIQFFAKAEVGNHGPDFVVRIWQRQKHIRRFYIPMNC